MVRGTMWVAFLLATLMPRASAQDYFTGLAMLKQCEQAERYLSSPGSLEGVAGAQAATCVGFLRGLATGILIGEGDAGRKKSRVYCAPDQFSLEQQLRVSLKWLRDHPARLHEDASILLALALKQSFPCSR